MFQSAPGHQPWISPGKIGPPRRPQGPRRPTFRSSQPWWYSAARFCLKCCWSAGLFGPMKNLKNADFHRKAMFFHRKPKGCYHNISVFFENSSWFTLQIKSSTLPVIGVGRLVSIQNGLFSKSMFIYQRVCHAMLDYTWWEKAYRIHHQQ